MIKSITVIISRSSTKRTYHSSHSSNSSSTEAQIQYPLINPSLSVRYLFTRKILLLDCLDCSVARLLSTLDTSEGLKALTVVPVRPFHRTLTLQCPIPKGSWERILLFFSRQDKVIWLQAAFSSTSTLENLAPYASTTNSCFGIHRNLSIEGHVSAHLMTPNSLKQSKQAT